MNTFINIGLAAWFVSFVACAQDWETVAVTTSPIESQREWKAQWLPLKWYPLKSPSSATVESISVQEGQQVVAGQTLMVLKQPQLKLSLEEALWNLEQKRLQLKQVQDWENSSEFKRAKNDWLLQKQACEQQAIKIEETHSLYELGGVALDLLKQEQNQWERCQIAQQQALDRFEATQSKGDAQAIMKSTLDVKKAALDYRQCLSKVQHLEVKAPVHGVFYSPHVFSNQYEYGQLFSNQPIQENQWLGVIAPPDDMGAVFEVHEHQLDAIERATVLELKVNAERIPAKIISEEPLNVMNVDETRSMKFHVKLKPMAPMTKAPRLGAYVSVTAIYHSDNPPLRVPLKALSWHQDKAYVRKKNTTSWDEVEVHILAMMNGYAHIEGPLKEGDRVGIAS